MTTMSAQRAYRRIALAVSLALLTGAGVSAQDKGALDPKPLPPLANPDDPKTPAKELFGRRVTPAPLSAIEHKAADHAQPSAHASVAAVAAAKLLGKPELASAGSSPVGRSRTVGFYAKGCLAGGVAL